MAALGFNMLVRKACKSFGNIRLRLPTGQVKIQTNIWHVFSFFGKTQNLAAYSALQSNDATDNFDPCSSILCLMRIWVFFSYSTQVHKCFQKNISQQKWYSLPGRRNKLQVFGLHWLLRKSQGLGRQSPANSGSHQDTRGSEYVMLIKVRHWPSLSVSTKNH